MKKITFLPVLLLTIVSTAFAQDSIDISGSAAYAYESEFVFRGHQIAGNTFTPSAEGRFISAGGTLYLGVHTALPTQKDDNKLKMHQYYVGGNFDVTEKISVDVGLSHYEFLPFTDDTAMEGTLGVAFDTVLKPQLRVFSDTDGDMTTFEASFGHAINMTEKTLLSLTGTVGTTEFYEGSTYATLMVDVEHYFTRYAFLSVGARLAALEPEDTDSTPFESDTRIWWGASFTAGF